MNFEDEYWVRLYKRKTPTEMVTSWDARNVRNHLLTEVDMRGRLDLGPMGLKALAATIRAPLDVVERGIAELVELGTIQLEGSVIVLPRFVEAQSAPMSGKARQRVYEERKRTFADEASPKPDETSVSPDAPSENLTPADGDLRALTKSDQKNRTDQNRTEKTTPKPPAGDAQVVWEYFLQVRTSVVKPGTRPPVFSPKRKSAIANRLKDFDVATLKSAVDALFRSRHHLGDNEDRKTYLDPEYVFRSTEQVEKMLKVDAPRPEVRSSAPRIRELHNGSQTNGHTPKQDDLTKIMDLFTDEAVNAR